MRWRLCLVGVQLLGFAGCWGAPAPDASIPTCQWQPEEGLLSESALQCWMGSTGGRWRRLKHHSHYDTLVVYVEVFRLADAPAVARQFVQAEKHRYSEIVIYAHPQPYSAAGLVRRMTWTERAGLRTLDFKGRFTD
jgi:hypothetical protein